MTAGVLTSGRAWARMVKLPHSVFALPFAFAGAVLAARGHGITAGQVGWIVLAMVSARNAAMGFNRLADHDYDARNPRTAGRELPAGVLGRPAVWAFTIALSVVFVVASFALNRACGWLSPVALAIVFAYSYTKRFTWASHLVLGLALAIAPVGGWLAVRGELGVVPWLLAGAVLLWVAGFDVLYACQDIGFDRAEGLRSIPVRFGLAGALRWARGLHAGAVVLLALVGWAAGLGAVHAVGVALIAVVLGVEHRLVREDDLSRIGVAFFGLNAAVGVLYLLVVLAAVLLPGWRA